MQLVLTKENIYLGHTRLSIIDLDDRSNQPFISQDASKILVFNGEIYNFKKIREILLANGLNFNTSGDTEVLLKSYEFWGEEMLNYIDGMFAFAIIDFNKNIIFQPEIILVKNLFFTVYKMDHLFFPQNLPL